MAIKQNSRIQIRSGLQQNLPQLAKGEFCWAVDTQRLFVGNGTVTDGAPYSGNTEIVTVPNAAGTSSGYGFPVAGIPIGTIDGVNRIFYIPSLPITNTLIVWKNFPLIPDIGYILNGNELIFSVAPQIGDNLYYFYWQYILSVVPSASSISYGPTTVSGSTNGTNTFFYVSDFPSEPDALILTLGGVVLNQNVDYYLSGKLITMTYAPDTNAILKAYYVI